MEGGKGVAEKKGVNEVILLIQGSEDSKGPLLTETSLYPFSNPFSKNSHFRSTPESVKDKKFEVIELDNLKNRVQMSMFSSSPSPGLSPNSNKLQRSQLRP